MTEVFREIQTIDLRAKTNGLNRFHPFVKAQRIVDRVRSLGHLLEHIFDDNSRRDETRAVFRRQEFRAWQMIHGQDDVLIAEKEIDYGIFEFLRVNQISVDRVEKQMRVVLLRVNEQMTLVGQLQIDDRIAQRAKCPQIDSMFHRMDIACSVQRTRHDQIQFDRHG